MPPDKYKAVWVSHSSMGDFLKCPRAYFLHNIYKDPVTNHKITIVNPALSLGQAVHEALENLKNIPAEERPQRNLLADFDQAWSKVTGSRGGFKNNDEELATKERGRKMIERVMRSPGPLYQKTIKIKESDNGMPSNFYLSEEENIILCGLIDWIEYIEADDSIRVLDFKTGKYEEDENSLQIPIYLLLLNALQKRKVSGAAYWYLERADDPVEVILPDASVAKEKVLAVARRMKAARENKVFSCPQGERGCFTCRPLEAVLNGQAELVGTGGYGQDMYRLMT